MIPLDDPTTLSRLFHLNSEPWLNDEAYRGGVGPREAWPVARLGEATALPPAPSGALATLIWKRQSCRAFANRSIAVIDVAAVLDAAYGLNRALAPPGEIAYQRRAVPSAGGLFPLEIFVFLRRVDGVADGIYHVDVDDRALAPIESGDPFPSLDGAFYTYPFVRDANVVVALAAVFERTQKKYGPRGYRYILLEAGHAGQNLCLAAAERGLATLCMGGFVDSLVNDRLGLNPAAAGVVYTVAVGHSL
jgi:SagB-type dehydrogenase family enzyme